ncbi:MAG: hypothetical protein H6521_08385 [Mycolicibacterium sp.]|nr:hypothetical protein [Mycolicibacterium sp.]
MGTPAYLGGVGGIALAVGHRGGSGERNAIATGRLVSSLHSGAADNFLAAVAEIDAADRWKAVAIMLAGDIASLACETHGEDAQK